MLGIREHRSLPIASHRVKEKGGNAVDPIPMFVRKRHGEDNVRKPGTSHPLRLSLLPKHASTASELDADQAFGLVVILGNSVVAKIPEKRRMRLQRAERWLSCCKIENAGMAQSGDHNAHP